MAPGQEANGHNLSVCGEGWGGVGRGYFVLK